MDHNNESISSKRFHFLDGLRGAAALWVLHFHAVGNIPNSIHWFSSFGSMGVWLFFVLSSFLLTSRFFSILEETGTSVSFIKFLTLYRRYLVKRVCRVYPLYVLFVVLNNALPSLEPLELWNCLLLIEPGLHLWTIKVEMHSYLYIPILCYVVYRFGRKWKYGLAAVSIFTAGISMLYPNSWHHLDLFFVGAIGGIIYHKGGPKLSKSIIFHPSLHFIVWTIFLLALGLSDHWFAKAKWQEEFHVFVYAPLLSVLFTLTILHGALSRSSFTRFFEWNFLTLNGIISYPLYLFHVWIIRIIVVYTTFDACSQYVLAFGSTMAIAYLIHLYIEKPLINKSTKVLASMFDVWLAPYDIKKLFKGSH